MTCIGSPHPYTSTHAALQHEPEQPGRSSGRISINHLNWRYQMLTAEQILASQKANVETLFGLTSKAFEGVEKLVELNLTATKAALAEAAGTTQAALGVKDAQQLARVGPEGRQASHGSRRSQLQRRRRASRERHEGHDDVLAQARLSRPNDKFTLPMGREL